MGRPKGWASDRTGRPVMWSPGRPPVVDAAAQAGVSGVVGVRWFRESGGMPTVTQAPLSGRYLSFAEREEIALLRAIGCGVREVARRLGRSPSTISRALLTLPRVAAVWTIEPRRRSGMQTVGADVRSGRSWP